MIINHVNLIPDPLCNGLYAFAPTVNRLQYVSKKLIPFSWSHEFAGVSDDGTYYSFNNPAIPLTFEGIQWLENDPKLPDFIALDPVFFNAFSQPRAQLFYCGRTPKNRYSPYPTLFVNKSAIHSSLAEPSDEYFTLPVYQNLLSVLPRLASFPNIKVSLQNPNTLLIPKTEYANLIQRKGAITNLLSILDTHLVAWDPNVNSPSYDKLTAYHIVNSNSDGLPLFKGSFNELKEIGLNISSNSVSVRSDKLLYSSGFELPHKGTWKDKPEFIAHPIYSALIPAKCDVTVKFNSYGYSSEYLFKTNQINLLDSRGYPVLSPIETRLINDIPYISVQEHRLKTILTAHPKFIKDPSAIIKFPTCSKTTPALLLHRDLVKPQLTRGGEAAKNKLLSLTRYKVVTYNATTFDILSGYYFLRDEVNKQKATAKVLLTKMRALEAQYGKLPSNWKEFDEPTIDAYFTLEKGIKSGTFIKLPKESYPAMSTVNEINSILPAIWKVVASQLIDWIFDPANNIPGLHSNPLYTGLYVERTFNPSKLVALPEFSKLLDAIFKYPNMPVSHTTPLLIHLLQNPDVAKSIENILVNHHNYTMHDLAFIYSTPGA